MQYRKAEIYPLDSLLNEQETLFFKGLITEEQYRIGIVHAQREALATQKWYVFYFYMHPFTGKFERFKVYEDINRAKGEGKLEYAKNLKKAVNESLKDGYNPFEEAEHLDTWLDETEKQALNDPGQYTMIRALNMFLNAKEEAGKSDSTIEAYTTAANFIRNWLNENGMLLVPAANITGQQFLQILKEESNRKDWKNKTYNNYLLCTETILNWLANDLNGIIPKNPIKGAELRTVLSKKHVPYTDKELFDLLQYVREQGDTFMESIIHTCYYACIRSKEELRAYRIGNILFDRDLIRLNAEGTKAREDQFIPLDPKLKEYYLKQGYDKLPADWYVYGNKKRPGPIRAANNFYANRFAEYRKVPELNLTQDHTLYGFKHTRGIHLAEAGTDPYAIMQLYRHSSLEQTMVYLRGLGCTINRKAVENSRSI